MHLDKCIMTCIHHYSIIRNSFTVLIILCAPPIHLSLPLNLWMFYGAGYFDAHPHTSLKLSISFYYKDYVNFHFIFCLETTYIFDFQVIAFTVRSMISKRTISIFL